jgi:hypothetical protein
MPLKSERWWRLFKENEGKEERKKRTKWRRIKIGQRERERERERKRDWEREREKEEEGGERGKYQKVRRTNGEKVQNKMLQTKFV